MTKRIRDKSKMFSMEKDNREKEHLVFAEFYKLPFLIHSGQNNVYYKDEDPTPFITDSSYKNYKLIEIPESTGKHLDMKLLATIRDVLNGQKFDSRLKNIVFKSGSLDGSFVSINDDLFIKVAHEDNVKHHMENVFHSTSKSAKSIRRSLMSYVIKQLNNGLIK